MNVREAAEIIGCSPAEIYKMERKGVMRRCKRLSGVRFNRNTILALTENTETELSPFIYRRTLKENEKLRAENSKLLRIIQERRKTPSFSYGDIRRVLRSPRRVVEGRFSPAWRGNVIRYIYTAGRAEIHAWGNRVSRSAYGWNAVVVEPRSPCL